MSLMIAQDNIQTVSSSESRAKRPCNLLMYDVEDCFQKICADLLENWGPLSLIDVVFNYCFLKLTCNLIHLKAKCVILKVSAPSQYCAGTVANQRTHILARRSYIKIITILMLGSSGCMLVCRCEIFTWTIHSWKHYRIWGLCIFLPEWQVASPSNGRAVDDFATCCRKRFGSEIQCEFSVSNLYHNTSLVYDLVSYLAFLNHLGAFVNNHHVCKYLIECDRSWMPRWYLQHVFV